MNDKNKKVMIIGGIVVALLVIVGFAFIAGQKKNAQKTTTPESLQNEEVVPTVDASVKVDLQAKLGKKEVTLSVQEVPPETTSVEYELSYDARGQGPQGSIGTINLSNGENSFERTITLGTCSSGTCVYHDVTGGVRILDLDGNCEEVVLEHAERAPASPESRRIRRDDPRRIVDCGHADLYRERRARTSALGDREREVDEVSERLRGGTIGRLACRSVDDEIPFTRNRVHEKCSGGIARVQREAHLGVLGDRHCVVRR